MILIGSSPASVNVQSVAAAISSSGDTPPPPPDIFTGFSDQDVRELTIVQLAALTTDKIALLSESNLIALNSEQIGAFTSAQLASITTAVLDAFSYSQISAISTYAISALTTKQFSVLTEPQIMGLSEIQIHALTTRQFEAVSIQQIAWFEGVDLVEFNSSQVQVLSASAIQYIPQAPYFPVGLLSTTQNQYLSVDFIASLSLTANATNLSMVGLGEAQISAFGYGFSGDQLASLTTYQVQWINYNTVNSIQADKLERFSTSQIAALSTPVLTSLDGYHISSLIGIADALSEEQLQQLNPTSLVTPFRVDGTYQDITLQGRSNFFGALSSRDGVNGFSVKRALTESQISALTDDELEALLLSKLSTSQLAAIAPSELPNIDSSYFYNIDVSAFTESQFLQLDQARLEQCDFANVTTSQVLSITDFNTGNEYGLVGKIVFNPNLIKVLADEQLTSAVLYSGGSYTVLQTLNALDSTQYLTTTQVARLSSTSIFDYGKYALDKQPPTEHTVPDPNVFAALSNQQIAALLDSAVLYNYEIPSSVLFSTSQLAGLTANSVSCLAPLFFEMLSEGVRASLISPDIIPLISDAAGALLFYPDSRIPKMTTSQIQSLTPSQIENLQILSSSNSAYTTTQIASFLPTQFAVLNDVQFTALISADGGGVDAGRLGVISTRQFTALSANCIEAISGSLELVTTSQISALSSDKFCSTNDFSGFGIADNLLQPQIEALTSSQLAGTLSSSGYGDISLLGLFIKLATDQSSYQINSLTSAQISSISTEAIAPLTYSPIYDYGKYLLQLDTYAIQPSDPNYFGWLTEEQFVYTMNSAVGEPYTVPSSGILTPAQVGLISPSMVPALDGYFFQVLGAERIAALTTSVVQSLNETQASSLLTVEQIPLLTTGIISSLTPTQFAAITNEQFNAFTVEQVSAVTESQVAANPEFITALTSEQIANLSGSIIAAIDTSQIAELTADQLSGLTTQFISALSTEQVAALSSTEIAVLNTVQIQAFSGEQFASLNTAQLQSLLSVDGELSQLKVETLTDSQLYQITNDSIRVISNFEFLTTPQFEILLARDEETTDGGLVFGTKDPVSLVSTLLTTGQLSTLTESQVQLLDPSILIKTGLTTVLPVEKVQQLSASQIAAYISEADTTIQIVNNEYAVGYGWYENVMTNIDPNILSSFTSNQLQPMVDKPWLSGFIQIDNTATFTNISNLVKILKSFFVSYQFTRNEYGTSKFLDLNGTGGIFGTPYNENIESAMSQVLADEGLPVDVYKVFLNICDSTGANQISELSSATLRMRMLKNYANTGLTLGISESFLQYGPVLVTRLTGSQNNIYVFGDDVQSSNYPISESAVYSLVGRYITTDGEKTVNGFLYYDTYGMYLYDAYGSKLPSYAFHHPSGGTDYYYGYSRVNQLSSLSTEVVTTLPEGTSAQSPYMFQSPRRIGTGTEYFGGAYLDGYSNLVGVYPANGLYLIEANETPFYHLSDGQIDETISEYYH
jgi:hypothetical protein